MRQSRYVAKECYLKQARFKPELPFQKQNLSEPICDKTKEEILTPYDYKVNWDGTILLNPDYTLREMDCSKCVQMRDIYDEILSIDQMIDAFPRPRDRFLSGDDYLAIKESLKYGDEHEKRRLTRLLNVCAENPKDKECETLLRMPELLSLRFGLMTITRNGLRAKMAKIWWD